MILKSSIVVSDTGFIFDPGTGDSFSANNSGKVIISMLKAGKSQAEIKKFFVQNYQVEASVFEHNLNDFISTISNYNLMESVA